MKEVINNRVIQELRYFNRTEQQELDKIFSILLASKDKQTILYLSLFKEIMMFKNMAQSFLLDYANRIAEAEARITELEHKNGKKTKY
jgi:hypothetical protein